MQRLSIRGMIAIILITLGGCSSLEDVRGTAPVRTGTFTGSYQDIGGCVTDALLATIPVTPITRPQLGLMTVTNILDNGVVRMPLWEATIRQTGPAGGTVEMRAMKTVWGTPGPDAALTWPTFEACGVTTDHAEAMPQR